MHLAAIAPATKTATLGSVAVEVTGLSFRKLAGLIDSFPQLVSLIAGGNLDPAVLIEQAPDAALGVFGLGLVGRSRPRWWKRSMLAGEDEEYRALRAAFEIAPAGQQIEILGAIFDLTTKGSDRAIPFLKAMLAPRLEQNSEPESAQAPAGQPTETHVESTPVSSSG